VVQNVETPVGSSGFPAPTTTNPCAVPAPNNSVNSNPVKPCALKFKNITSNYMLVGISNYKFGIADDVFGIKYITFNIQVGIPSSLANGKKISVEQAQLATSAAFIAAETYLAQTHGVDFFLSAGAQITYSREFASYAQSLINIALQITSASVTNNIGTGVPIITYADNNCL
jgi:hypothetical protein